MVVHLRLYFDYLHRNLGPWYVRVFNTLFAVGGAGALLIYCVVALVFAWKGTPAYWDYVGPVSLLIVIQPYLSGATNYLEAHREQRKLAVFNVSQRLLPPIFLLLLLATAVPQTTAVIVSQVAGGLFLIFTIRTPRSSNVSSIGPDSEGTELRNLINSITAFGWELPIGYVVMWLVTTSDRYIIQHFMTLHDVGLYAMNYGIWSMPYLMLNGVLEIMTRSSVYESAARSDWGGVQNILLWRSAVALLLGLAGTCLLYFLANPIGAAILGEQYRIDRQFVIIIALAHCFCILGYSILPVFLAAKRSQMIMWSSVAAAICNLSLNWFVIPTFGLTGAALATLLTYMLWSAILWGGGYYLKNSLAAKEQYKW